MNAELYVVGGVPRCVLCFLGFFQSCPVSYTKKKTHILNGKLNLALLSPKLQLFPQE